MGNCSQIQHPDHLYSDEEISDLMRKALDLGFSLDAGSDLEKLTIRDLDILVHRVQ